MLVLKLGDWAWGQQILAEKAAFMKLRWLEETG
jgi:hypothetical protein